MYSYQYKFLLNRTVRYSYKIIENNTHLNIDLNFLYLFTITVTLWSKKVNIYFPDLWHFDTEPDQQIRISD